MNTITGARVEYVSDNHCVYSSLRPDEWYTYLIVHRDHNVGSRRLTYPSRLPINVLILLTESIHCDSHPIVEEIYGRLLKTPSRDVTVMHLCARRNEYERTHHEYVVGRGPEACYILVNRILYQWELDRMVGILCDD